MPSLGCQHRACYFRDAYLKAAEVWALHAGIAPYTNSIIYGPHLYFTGLPKWGWGGYGSHHHYLNNMRLMMSQGWEGSWGWGEVCDEDSRKRLKMWGWKGVGGWRQAKVWGRDITWELTEALHRSCRFEWCRRMHVLLLASLPPSYQWIIPRKQMEVFHQIGWFGHCCRSRHRKPHSLGF